MLVISHTSGSRVGGAGMPSQCQARHFPSPAPNRANYATTCKLLVSWTSQKLVLHDHVQMFRSKAKQLSEAPKLTIRNNPYKARKQWPPDFSKLHPRYQFRLERRYRRRAKLRYSRPGWVRGVKLAANGSVFRQLLFPTLPHIL